VSASHDFWLSCGHHLLDRDASGRLLLTDDFLKAYLARPELMPPPEACAAEQALHDALLRDPRQPVGPAQIAEIADADARENWQMMMAWRDHLGKHSNLEAAYLAIVRSDVHVPQILMGQLVQVILRNALDGCTDVFMLRAAEMFFRSQKLVLQEGSMVAVDEESDFAGGQHSSPLSALLELPVVPGTDLLSEASADSYWDRSDRFDMGLDLAAGGRALAALGNVIGRFLAHLLAIEVAVEPVSDLREIPWNWYVGLSSEATRIGDAIWRGVDLDDATRARLIGLFRLTFRNAADMIAKVRGEPVHLLLAMTANGVLRLKPQNLLTGLPILDTEVAS
jgi:hypothetical protein